VATSSEVGFLLQQKKSLLGKLCELPQLSGRRKPRLIFSLHHETNPPSSEPDQLKNPQAGVFSAEAERVPWAALVELIAPYVGNCNSK